MCLCVLADCFDEYMILCASRHQCVCVGGGGGGGVSVCVCVCGGGGGGVSVCVCVCVCCCIFTDLISTIAVTMVTTN